MTKRQFNKQLLDEILQRDEATLVGDYETLNSNKIIKFICSCGIVSFKKFHIIVHSNGGMKCKSCVYNKSRISANKTCLEKYGVINVSQLNNVKEKKEMSSLKKYGVTNISKSEDIKIAKRKTLNNNYGTNVPLQSQIIQEKMHKTMKEKYGVEHAQQSQEIQEKTIKTNLQKYGVERPSQSQEIQEQNQHKAYKRKDFTMPSGDVRIVQGAEPFALRDLLEEGYTEDQIKTNRQDVPRIQYFCGDKQRYYFPDIFLPHENKLIEVKSTWTYKTDWDKKLKYQQQCCKDQGYTYEIWIYNQKGLKTSVI